MLFYRKLQSIIFNKRIIIIVFYLFSEATAAATAQKIPSLYQIDLIVFIHQDAALSLSLPTTEPFFFPKINKSISLTKKETNSPIIYTLLPAKNSDLQKEYYALSKNSSYSTLLHYSWLQPLNEGKTIRIEPIINKGWQVQGSINVKHYQYYQLNTKLSFSTNNGTNNFLLEKKERLNANTIYYLDDPKAGIIIKIHAQGK